MSDQKEFKEIKEIDHELILIREKVSLQNENIRAFVEKINKLNMKFDELRQEIRQKKIERDKLNDKVRILKEKRSNLHFEIKKKVEAIKKYRKKIDVIKGKLFRRNGQDLIKEFEKLEWKIQTTTLKLDEERELVEKVKILGTQISKYKKIDEQNLKIRKLSAEIQKFQQEAHKAHIELIELAKKSQEIHVIISSKIDELKITKDKADKHHRAYLDIKEHSIPLQTKSRELSQKKRELLNKLEEKEKNRRKETEKKLKKKIKSEAQAKIKNKEKLSWDEFKLLTESDHKNNK